MISRHHKTIFVHIPKAAGQSVEMVFLSDLGLTWQTRESLLLRRNDDSAKGPPRLAHLKASDYVRLGYISRIDFEQYFKFAVVRNPWSRTVSLYRHLHPNMSFRDFANVWLPRIFRQGEAASEYWFVRAQSDFVLESRTQIVDDILRLENITEDFARVAARIEVNPVLPRVNTSDARTPPDRVARPTISRQVKRAIKKALVPVRYQNFGNWRDYYDPKSVDSIGDIYSADVKRFDYSFEEKAVSA